MDIGEVSAGVGIFVGFAVLIGSVIKASNSLTRIEVILKGLIEQSNEHKLFRRDTEAKHAEYDVLHATHKHRISALENDVDELKDDRRQ